MTPVSLAAYRLATAAAAPFAGALLSLRLNRGKEDPDRIDERRGLACLARPDGPLVWLHGASVGETVSLLPLVERLTQSGVFALVTSGTVTSARLMAARLPPRAIHQFVPLDCARFVRRFLAHWRPGLGLFAESEIWPNMILEAARARVPLALVNARMSERSFRRWRHLSGAARGLFNRFEATLAQTPGDALRLSALGSPSAPVIGNLKYDAPAPPADLRDLAELSGLVAGRRLWIAASTHPGEERIAAQTHQRLALQFPDLLTLIAPRHPERGAAVAAVIESLGLASARRSQGARPERDVSIYICDTMGELGLFYRLAGVAFLGKSLTGGGGQNPIEAAKLGAALLHGPRIANFADVYAPLDAEGGALPVKDADDLAAALAQLFDNPARLREMARAAARVVERGAGAVERTLDALEPHLATLVR